MGVFFTKITMAIQLVIRKINSLYAHYLHSKYVFTKNQILIVHRPVFWGWIDFRGD